MNVLTKAAVQGAACGLMIGAVLLVGEYVWRPTAVAAQAPKMAGVVRAGMFMLVNEAGRVRATVATSNGNPFLTLSDAGGKERAKLSLLSDGTPSLELYDAAGNLQVELSASSEGNPGLILWDARENMRVRLGLDGGSPSLTLFDAARKGRATLGTTTLGLAKTGAERKRSESSLVFFDQNEKSIWEAP